MDGHLNPFSRYYHSKIGLMQVEANNAGVTSISFVETRQKMESAASHPIVEDCIVQLDEYFQGLRREFSIRLDPRGTDFQKKVWDCLLTIPYGQTISYHDIATALGKPHANQSVGNANGKNPVAIVIPCHRVLGKNGKLTGYAGGLWRKEWLLKHEGALIA